MTRISRLLIACLALALSACATPAPAGPFHMKGGGAASGSYPAVIVTSGNQVAWDTRTTAHARIALTPLLSLTPITGSTYTGGGNPNLAITGSPTLAGIDFTGATLSATGAGAITITDALFGDPGKVAKIMDNGANPASVSFCEFNLVGIASGGEPSINAGGGLTVDSCAFREAPRDYIDSSVSLSVSRSFFQSYCVNPPNSSFHCEAVHHFGGAVNYTDTLFDPATGSPIAAGITGTLFFEGTSAPITFTLTRVVMINSRAPGVGYLYPMQCTPRHHSVTGTITGSALSKGSTGYILKNATTTDLQVTGITGTFVGGETVTQGGASAVLSSGLQVADANYLPVASLAGSAFTNGATITGGTSLATATLTSVNVNTCTVTNGGGNYDFDTLAPIASF